MKLTNKIVSPTLSEEVLREISKEKKDIAIQSNALFGIAPQFFSNEFIDSAFALLNTMTNELPTVSRTSYNLFPLVNVEPAPKESRLTPEEEWGFIMFDPFQFLIRAHMANVQSCHTLAHSGGGANGGQFNYLASPYWGCVGAYKTKGTPKLSVALGTNIISDDVLDGLPNIQGTFNLLMGFDTVSKLPMIMVSRNYGTVADAGLQRLVVFLKRTFPGFGICWYSSRWSKTPHVGAVCKTGFIFSNPVKPQIHVNNRIVHPSRDVEDMYTTKDGLMVEIHPVQIEVEPKKGLYKVPAITEEILGMITKRVTNSYPTIFKDHVLHSAKSMPKFACDKCKKQVNAIKVRLLGTEVPLDLCESCCVDMFVAKDKHFYPKITNAKLSNENMLYELKPSDYICFRNNRWEVVHRDFFSSLFYDGKVFTFTGYVDSVKSNAYGIKVAPGNAKIKILDLSVTRTCYKVRGPKGVKFVRDNVPTNAVKIDKKTLSNFIVRSNIAKILAVSPKLPIYKVSDMMYNEFNEIVHRPKEAVVDVIVPIQLDAVAPVEVNKKRAARSKKELVPA